MAIATLWFALTYLGLALGKIPGTRLDRTGIALVGATLMLTTVLISLPEAVRAVSFETILLLFGMMIVVGYLHLAGFFERLTDWTLARFHTPSALLAVTISLAGVLSAFLVNDIVCVALTPLVLRLARRLKIDPTPHLIGLATASNIGSSATITGNPQNMIIGNLSGIPYIRFIARLAPPALVGLVLAYVLIAAIYRNTLAVPSQQITIDTRRARPAHRWLLWKSLTVTLAAIVLFFCSAPVAYVALGAAAIMLCGRVRPTKVYRHVDWGLLVMFCGLFVVVRSFQTHVVDTWHIDRWRWLLDSPVVALSGVSVVLSNLVSNVPAVLLFEPIIAAMNAASRETAWLALAMSSTFAGNLTVLGSVANLIVVEQARREGTEITFGEYCRVGVPLTLLTLAVGVAWLRFVPY